MTTDIKNLIDNRPVTSVQLSTIFVCFLMNMLDGMDVQVISYTAPTIASSWKIGPSALGTVFSAGLLGMTLGAMFLAPFADKIGRKNLIIISAMIMGLCIYATSFAQSVVQLAGFRFFSGLGIGSMLATTAALAAEYTPNKTREIWISFVVAGYPAGAFFSGLVAGKVIPTQGWEQMFRLAGLASFITLPFVYFFLSESIDFYIKKQPSNALKKINSILNKMGISPLEILPDKVANKSQIPINQLFREDLKKSTIQLWSGLFMAFAALYFLTSWIPKLAKDAGLSMELAIYSGAVFNVGAFFGILTQGYFSSRFGLKKTIGIILILTAALMASFGFFVGSDIILLIFALLGFGIQGGFVGLYAVAARMYPTEFRTTGVGWAMGAGRLGSILGPYLGGILIGTGYSIGANFAFFAIPALLAGIITMKISSKNVS